MGLKKGTIEAPQAPTYPKFFNGAFFFLGVTSLMTFNSIITPYDFFARFYPSVILSSASLTYNACNMLITIFVVLFSDRMKLYPRILAPMIMWIIALIIIPLSQFIFPDVNNNLHMNFKLAITLIACAMSGIANGFFFPSLMYIAGSIPNSNGACIAQVCSGQGLSGIIPEALVIIIKGLVQAFSSEPTTGGTDQEVMFSTLSFFIIGCLIVAASIGLWTIMIKKYPEYIKLSNEPKEAAPEINKEEGIEGEIAVSTSGSEKLNIEESNISEEKKEKDLTYKEMFKLLIEPAISVWAVYLITLTIFPGLYTKVPCIHTIKNRNELDKTGWWGVLIMSIFMVGDQIGRSLMTINALLRKMTPHIACALSWSRLIFYVLFILMMLPTPQMLFDPESPSVQIGWRTPYISSDIGSMFIMLVFAISNGIAGTANMSVWGQKLKNPSAENIRKGANVMTLMLNFGLFCGAFSSLGIDSALAKL